MAGDRLVLCAVWIGYEAGDGVDMLQIIVFDELVEQMEQLISFDVDDVDVYCMPSIVVDIHHRQRRQWRMMEMRLVPK